MDTEGVEARRRAARVIAVDPDERVLLFGYRNPATGLEFWATPGGGIEPGETADEAARREFREETAHDPPKDLGPIVWRRAVRIEWGDEWQDQDEVFFFARVDAMTIPAEHVAELEEEGVIGCRWLSLDQIRRRRGFEVAPRRLADLVEDLLENGPPADAFDVGL